MNPNNLLLSGWTWNATAVGAVAAGWALYFLHFRAQRRLGWMLAAGVVLLLTLMSPLNTLAAGYLFSAHMVQHIVLLLAVPALVWLSLPRSQTAALRPGGLGHPIIGWAAGVGAMWFWHAPALCDAAVVSAPIHAAQTGSLLLAGGLFWRQILAPRESERLSPPAAVLYLFSACLTCSALGIIITLSPVTVCSAYAAPPLDPLGILPLVRGGWGFTPARDQQIGGLLMWVPMCLVFLSAIFVQIARWFAEPPLPRLMREGQS